MRLSAQHRLEQAFYTEAGKETYNQKNVDKAKKLLAEGGYKGEKLILLTNKDYTNMYTAALVMSEQLKAIGMNVELLVLDWPALCRSSRTRAIRAAGTSSIPAMHQHVVWRRGGDAFPRAAVQHLPAKDDVPDAEIAKFFNEITNGKTLDERKADFLAPRRACWIRCWRFPPPICRWCTNVENFWALLYSAHVECLAQELTAHYTERGQRG